MGEYTVLEYWAWMAGATVVNVLWQGALIGVLGALILGQLRHSTPQVRYSTACVALGAMVLLLPLNLLLLSPPTPAIVEPLAQAALNVEVLPEHAAATTPTAPIVRPRVGQINWYDRVLPWVGGCWWAGIVLFAFYDLMGILAVRRLRQQARPAGAELVRRAADVARRVGANAAIQVQIVEGISSALVTGFFRVIILIPSSMAAGLSPDALEAILAHEFAHVRRWDRWLNLLQRCAEALLFFHPAAWWLTRIISAERELCCDEIALRVCPDRARYARTLLSLAEQENARRQLALSSHGGSLTQRIQFVLGRRGVSDRPGRLAVVTGALVAAVVPLIAMLWTWRVGAAELPERQLHFPVDRIVGSVQGRWRDDAAIQHGKPWLTEYSAGWTVLDEARGPVVVPENTRVKLSIARDNLDYLRTLDPDAVYFLDGKFKALTDDEVAPIAHLTGLRALDLSDNHFTMTGAALGRLGALQNLEWLDFQRTGIDNLPKDGFAQFKALRYLAGHFKTYSDDVLRQAGTLENLEFLCLKEGPSTAAGLRHLAGMESLRGLVLDNQMLTDEAFSVLHSLPNLSYLDIRKNPLTDAALDVVESFTGLQYLNLGTTQITDAGVARLAGLQELREIVLSETSVTEACLDSLDNLPNLHTANFLRSGVSDEAAANFMEARAPRRPRNARRQTSSNPNAPRVGILMSHFTTIGPIRPGYELAPFYSYKIQNSIDLAKALDEANFDVYAVVEPRTEYLGELPGILRDHGLAEKVVDGTNPEALADLDAIIACGAHDTRVAVLDAIGQAVEWGTGLVIIGALGDLEPGEFHPSVVTLTGVSQATYINLDCQDAACRVLAAHPLLGDTPPDSILTVHAPQGVLNATGQIEGGTALLGPPSNFPDTFTTLYVRAFGQGRIVRCQWHFALQPRLPYPGFAFYVRALNWSSHEEPAAVW